MEINTFKDLNQKERLNWIKDLNIQLNKKTNVYLVPKKHALVEINGVFLNISNLDQEIQIESNFLLSVEKTKCLN